MKVTFKSACMVLAGGFFAAACTPASSPDATPIASLHAHQCSKCHAAPEPKTLSRAQLEEAFGRHKKRVHLSADEWTAMVDYLAAPPGAASSQKD